ncbi:MAG: hypothetical protein OXH52_00670 [Gammaproteobacteria bacterium]|nr:hypothetical protein [Gammaproteobacteria bacterium]
MQIVFSRKGFDSALGGSPSPIIDGRPVSIPIPTAGRSKTTCGDLGLGPIVHRATSGRLNGADLCHHDPMFEQGRCAVGQTEAAQSHLDNNGTGIGDVFLFFGLFSDSARVHPHHRIFGYLEVTHVTKPGAAPDRDRQLLGCIATGPGCALWRGHRRRRLNPAKRGDSRLSVAPRGERSGLAP